ncbi:MAG: ANTAR domain-containing protein [Alphaproteobacteria bacterium]|nr:ANTAR domain-containing protein [Alphaproteobacteria bacterium]
MYIRLKEPRRRRALLVNLSGEPDALLEEMLLERGVVVVSRCVGRADIAEMAAPPDCDLAVIYIAGPTRAPAETITLLAHKTARPVLVIIGAIRPDEVGAMIDAGANGVFAIGVATDRLGLAIAQATAIHAEVNGHRHRASRAVQELEDRKLIERAKGILMETRRISEPQAFRYLQQTSMDRNESMPAVARTVIAAKELLG